MRGYVANVQGWGFPNLGEGRLGEAIMGYRSGAFAVIHAAAPSRCRTSGKAVLPRASERLVNALAKDKEESKQQLLVVVPVVLTG